MWSSIVIVLAAMMMQMHRHPASAQDLYDKTCITPDGEDGYCQNIRSCNSLLDLFQERSHEVADFLRKSICDFVGLDALVCCPILDIRIDDKDNEHNRNNNNNNDDIYSQSETLLSSQCGKMNDAFLPVVAGGVPASTGNWPWIAALGYRGKQDPKKPRWLCGGSLISSRHVLTAGHCVHGRDDLFLVRLGELDLDSDNDGADPIDVFIANRTIHPQYNPSTYTNDIAVLRLQQEVEFTSSIKPICLPVNDEIKRKDLVNAFPFLVGWGTIYFNGPRRSQLQEIQVPIISEAECKEAFKNFKTATIDYRVICAGYSRGGKDACQGDSGGPLMYQMGRSFYVIGVVSYGFKCAEPGFPGVYSKTTSFLDFILPLLN